MVFATWAKHREEVGDSVCDSEGENASLFGENNYYHISVEEQYKKERNLRNNSY